MSKSVKYSTSPSSEEVVRKKIPTKPSAKKKLSSKSTKKESSSPIIVKNIKKPSRKKKEISSSEEEKSPEPTKSSSKKPIKKEETPSPEPIKVKSSTKKSIKKEESPVPIKVKYSTKKSIKKEETPSPEPIKTSIKKPIKKEKSPVPIKVKSSTKKPIKKEETSSPEPIKVKSSTKKPIKKEETSSPEPIKVKSSTKKSIKKESSSSEEEVKSVKKGVRAKIPHSSKKEKEINVIRINDGRLLSFPPKEEKSFLENMKDYILSIDLATIRNFFKALKGDVDLYPTLKGSLRDTGLAAMERYEDFVNAPSDPIISNISLGFLEDFIPKFKMLLLNLTRIGGPTLVSSFLNSIGFTETKLLRLFKIGKDPKDQLKILAKMFVQISNPLGWVLIISNIIKSGYNVYKYFDNGGVIGKLGLIKDSEGIEKKIRTWSDKVLRTTLSSMLDDLTSVIEDADNRDNSNKILKLLLLGTGKSKISEAKQEKVESKSYLEPILTRIKVITKPINKQVGNIASEMGAQTLDYLINKKYNFEVKELFPKESLLLLNKEDGYEVEDEESVQWALQEIGGLTSILISNLLASFATSFEGVNFKPEELLTKEVDTSYISSSIRKVFGMFKK